MALHEHGTEQQNQAGRSTNVPVLLHVAAVAPAAVVGAAQLLAKKGGPRHRLVGRWWVGLMAIGAVTSFGIQDSNPGHFSWIHGLSVATLVSLGLGVRAARRNNIAAHRMCMAGCYGGLVTAGVFAFAPNRKMGQFALQGTVPWR
ncbi:hypothetical protein HDU91_000374 [Kappamyces sp. JEL0680]|nr:hypothetical protein HDU91_000374 [Kappamyces sp. JEL0680]